MAVIIEINKPMISVVAKPLIDPEPSANKISATISVVTLASIIVEKARSYPAWMLAKGLMP